MVHQKNADTEIKEEYLIQDNNLSITLEAIDSTNTGMSIEDTEIASMIVSKIPNTIIKVLETDELFFNRF